MNNKTSSAGGGGRDAVNSEATGRISIDTGHLCIPRIDSSIKKEYIFKKICDMKIGYIQKFVEIPLKNNPQYKRILFKVLWNNDSKTTSIKERLNEDKPIYIVYNKPWFWRIVNESKNL